jgi:hypothetical protein
MKFYQFAFPVCLTLGIALSGCSDDQSNSNSNTSQHTSTQKAEMFDDLPKVDRAEEANSLRISDLADYWILNPGVREFGIAKGRFTEGNKPSELKWAKTHLRWNPQAKWKSS